MSTVITKRNGVFSSVREALVGNTHRDFTEEGIGRAITLLAIPMVLEMMMESLFAIVDMFWVGHLGADAVATVGFTEAVLMLLYTIALGLAMATAATVARRIGEKDPRSAAETAGQSILMGVGLGILFGAMGGWFAPQLLEIMGGTGGVLLNGRGYTRAILGGSGTVLLLFLINSVFRGAGDAALAMRVLWTANAINIVLNPLLIFGIGPFPRLGLTGSGVGTTIGRGCGVLLQLWLITQGKSRVVVHLRDFQLRPLLMLRILRLSLGGMLQYFVGTSSWILMVRMASAFGATFIAGYTLMIRLVMFAILPSWGVANAAATLVGQNLGAKKPERAEAAVWKAGLYNMILLGLIGLVFFTFAEKLTGIFTREAAVVAVASTALRIVASGYLFYAWGMVVIQAFNGAGDTITPTIINFFCFWMCQLPLAWWLSFKTPIGSSGVFWAIAIAQSILAVVGVLAFRSGKWKGKKV